MIEQRIKELGIVWPKVPEPQAAYIPTIQTGQLIYTAGMSSIQNGVRTYVGRLGEDLTVEEGYQSARLCAINCLAAIRKHTGSLDQVKRVVKLTGFIRSSTSFTEQHKVLNGASDVIEAIFGDSGKHVRSAIGVNELPFGICVEVEMIVELQPTATDWRETDG
jgi:enamine deaminase RidA (YjgF/YER057c/UK114 family)